MNTVDQKLLDIIDNAVKTTSNSIDALSKILEYRKTDEGMIGFHFSVYPTADHDITSEAIASEIIDIMKDHASGNTKEVDITKMDY